MHVNCSICGGYAASRPIKARGGKDLMLWHCPSCDFDFLAHDPSRDLAADKLDDSRLRAAGLDIPTRERDFANGLEQSRPYIVDYLRPSDKSANVLEVGCSWGYFLKLVEDAGANPFGIEINRVRAQYVNDELNIPCDASLQACENRGVRFRKIFLFYVLEYVPQPVAYLQRLLEMLEEGGELVVVTPSLTDALKDLWRNEAFSRFFYDEHAINYLTPRAAGRMLARLRKRGAAVSTRQGYSFVNHVNWFLTNAPRTTGVVGGDNFVVDIVRQLRPDIAPGDRVAGRGAPAARLADLIARFDAEYRGILEESLYGNQIRIVITK
ncbi:MAG: class I SAM-dependent methyltransferase [Steroidobacteraceae bacterium]